MIHRHLDYRAKTPAASVGDAALDDILDRGDFGDWQALARDIVGDPFGEVAERVLRLCDTNPKYGTSPLWRAWIGRHRRPVMMARAMAQPGTAPALTLAEIRGRYGVSQRELGERIGMSQSDLSKAERRADWKASTLVAIAGGLGLRVRLVVEDAEGRLVAAIKSGPQPTSD